MQFLTVTFLFQLLILFNKPSVVVRRGSSLHIFDIYTAHVDTDPTALEPTEHIWICSVHYVPQENSGGCFQSLQSQTPGCLLFNNHDIILASI